MKFCMVPTDTEQRKPTKKKGEVVGHVIGAKIRAIDGRLWFCSRSLSKKKRLVISEHDYCFQSLSDVIQNAELRCYREIGRAHV